MNPLQISLLFAEARAARRETFPAVGASVDGQPIMTLLQGKQLVGMNDEDLISLIRVRHAAQSACDRPQWLVDAYAAVMENPAMTITVKQRGLVRERAMRAVREQEAAIIEHPEDFGPEGLAAANAELDELMAVVRELDKGATEIILGKAVA